MKENELRQYLRQQYPREDATCEWKAFSTLKNNIAGRKGEDLVSYISAIANIHGGHLVIGVEDQTLNILGIQDFQDYTPENLPHRLMGNCTNLSSEMLWVEAFETEDSHKIVWIVHIPKHLPRKPVYAHRVAWQRIGDSLVPMSPEREHHILTEPMPLRDDWSAGIVPTATIDDLDERALRMAREKYSEKYRHISAEIDLWDTMTFLNKAKLSIKGQITRAALLLLGKSESEHFVAPADAKIRWILKSTDNRDLDWQVFNIPFILAVDGVYGKIRNLMYRYLPDGTLFPDEVLRFEPFTIREALCNCIAHQDYTLSGRINVIQKGDDELIFTNQGYFLPPSVEKLVEEDTPQDEYYRNRFLVEAMANLKMVDTIGSGIRKMFEFQRRRFFPMPEYLLQSNRVEVRIIGRVLDVEFARTLALNPGFSLNEIIMLDKVQKRRELSDKEIKYLKQERLIEGRKPNFILSAKAVEPLTEELKAQYVRQKGFDDNHYKKIIIEYIDKFGNANRKAIDQLLMGKLPEIFNEKQKKTKIGNLLTALKLNDIIENKGSNKKPLWVKKYS